MLRLLSSDKGHIGHRCGHLGCGRYGIIRRRLDPRLLPISQVPGLKTSRLDSTRTCGDLNSKCSASTTSSPEDWTSIRRIHKSEPLGHKTFGLLTLAGRGGVPARFPFLEDRQARRREDRSRMRKPLWHKGFRRERATGVEPATSSLGSWHSTAELRPQNAVVSDADSR